MITSIQNNTSSCLFDSNIDSNRTLADSTVRDIHVAQARQTLGDLENYKQGDLLRNLLPHGKKGKISTKTIAKHVAYLEGFLTLISKMTDTAVNAMKINGEMSDLTVNNADVLQRDGVSVSAKTSQAMTEYAAEKQKAEEMQKTMAIIGYIMAAVMIVMSLGTGSAAGVLMAACIAAQQCMSNIKDKDGKTAMDKLTDACGGKKWAADLIVDACVLVLTCGAGFAEAGMNSAADLAETGVSQGVKEAAEDGAEDGAEEAVGDGAQEATEGAAEDGTEEASEQGASKVGKKTAEELKKEAEEKLKEAITKQVSKSQVETAAKKALSKETLNILKQGLTAGVKLGMQIDMTVFNPLGDAFSDIYYNANLRPGMSELEKQKLKGDAELYGAIFGAGTSFVYGVSSFKCDCLNGFKGSSQIFKLDPSKMQLLLQVTRAIQAVSLVGQGVTAAILSSIFKDTANTQTEIASYQGQLAKVKFAIDTTSEVRDQIQKEAAKNSSFFFNMLDMMMKASKTAFKLN